MAKILSANYYSYASGPIRERVVICVCLNAEELEYIGQDGTQITKRQCSKDAAGNFSYNPTNGQPIWENIPERAWGNEPGAKYNWQKLDFIWNDSELYTGKGSERRRKTQGELFAELQTKLERDSVAPLGGFVGKTL